MSGSAFMRPRLVLFLLLALLVEGIVVSASAAPVQQTSTPASTPISTPTPTPQPTKPILLTDPVPDPKQEGVRWFSATGHTLRGEFLDYWTRYGGLEQFGYPLTEEFFEEVGPENKQYRVQYFERNRFEHHPENAGTPHVVLLGTLGREFRQQEPPAQPLPAPAVYFRETGHNLSGVFKGYWDTHGGLFVHGFPITEEVEERSSTDGKVYRVQYFERSRFEYHPENRGTKYEVLLGLLGRGLAERKGYPFGWYPPFGRATDFSWVSGKIGLFIGLEYTGPFAGCHIFHYEQGERAGRLQLQMLISYREAQAELSKYVESQSIVFGHLARSGEYRICAADPVPGYLIDQIHKNPKP